MLPVSLPPSRLFRSFVLFFFFLAAGHPIPPETKRKELLHYTRTASTATKLYSVYYFPSPSSGSRLPRPVTLLLTRLVSSMVTFFFLEKY